MKTTNTWTDLWGQPLLIGLLSIAGLISALVGDGIFDVIAWLCLLYPLIRLSYHYWKKPATERVNRQRVAAAETTEESQLPIEELAYTIKENEE